MSKIKDFELIGSTSGIRFNDIPVEDIPVEDEYVSITVNSAGLVTRWGTDAVSKRRLVAGIDQNLAAYTKWLKDVPQNSREHEVLDSMYIQLKFLKNRIVDGEFDKENLP